MKERRCCEQMRASLSAALAAVAVAAGAPSAARASPPLCAPRTGEKLGVRFLEVCASNARDVLGEAYDRALPAFWIAAAPLPCSEGSHETVDCPTLTPLEASPVGSLLRNRPQRAAMVEAATAHQLCTLRFGGRLPTPEEREQARHVLGLVSLLVREASHESARMRFDELPEWVAGSECVATPSNLGPGCQVTLSPPVILRPRAAGDRLLACDAELADVGPEASLPLAGECEAAVQGDTLRPRCAIVVPHAALPSRFTLACRAAPLAAAEAAAQPSDALAAFRCVVPESSLGRLGEPGGSRSPPRAP